MNASRIAPALYLPLAVVALFCFAFPSNARAYEFCFSDGCVSGSSNVFYQDTGSVSSNIASSVNSAQAFMQSFLAWSKTFTVTTQGTQGGCSTGRGGLSGCSTQSQGEIAVVTTDSSGLITQIACGNGVVGAAYTPSDLSTPGGPGTPPGGPNTPPGGPGTPPGGPNTPSGGSSGGSGNSCTPTTPVCQSNGNLLNNCGQTTACPYGCSGSVCLPRTCTPAYTCSGNTIIYTDSTCAASTVAECAPPSFCSPGVSTCQNPPIGFTTFDATGPGGSFSATGHLMAFPSLVPQGSVTHLYWNVANAHSCSITGNNGDSWTDVSSGSSGQTSGSVMAQTVYTLSCQALPGALPANVNESVTVSVVPIFLER